MWEKKSHSLSVIAKILRKDISKWRPDQEVESHQRQLSRRAGTS